MIDETKINIFDNKNLKTEENIHKQNKIHVKEYENKSTKRESFNPREKYKKDKQENKVEEKDMINK